MSDYALENKMPFFYITHTKKFLKKKKLEHIFTSTTDIASDMRKMMVFFFEDVEEDWVLRGWWEYEECLEVQHLKLIDLRVE